MKAAALLFAAVFAVAGCTSGKAAEAKKPTVDIEVGDDFFAPLNGTIEQGTKILFHNTGQHNHTVTIHLEWLPEDEYEIDKEMGPGEDVGYRFEEEATYHVFCRLHGAIGSGMHLDVTTQE